MKRLSFVLGICGAAALIGGLIAFQLRTCRIVPNSPVKRIIVIAVDTLRTDHLSLSGYQHTTSPFIDRMARDEAVVFEQARASSSWTLPSTVSLLTGLHPHQHAVEDRGERLDASVPTLAGVLSEHGWHTAAFITHIYVSSLFGIDSGFDEFHELSIDWEFREGKQLRAEALNKQVLPWLERHRDEHFFLYLHYFDPHWDYDAPGKYLTKFTDPDYRGTARGNYDFISTYIPTKNLMSAPDLAQIIGLYNGEIAYTDYHLGQLFAFLKQRGMWDDTVLVLLSDHGEEFQDHGSMHHIRTLYEEVLRVPLIIKPVGGRTACMPPRIPQPVGTIGVGPTLLEMVGIPRPKSFQASSLMPFLEGTEAVEPLFSRTRRHKSDKMAIVYKGHKLIVPFGRGKGPMELYDLADDPDERHSLVAAKPEMVKMLLKQLEKITSKTTKVLDLPGAQQGIILTDDQKNRLKALGYLE